MEEGEVEVQERKSLKSMGTKNVSISQQVPW